MLIALTMFYWNHHLFLLLINNLYHLILPSQVEYNNLFEYFVLLLLLLNFYEKY